MKVSAGRVASFVANPDPAILAILVYGPNAGLVREHCESMAGTILEDPDDPFQSVELTGSAMTETPTRLADEMLALSLGGGRRLVTVRNATDSITKSLESALDAGSESGMNAVALIESGALTAKSSLRKLCEKRDDCAALPCYADDDESRARLARGLFNEAGISINPDALRTLTGLLGDDRLSNRREIEKLILLVGPEGTAQEADVLAAVGDISATTLDETVFAAAGGDIGQLDRSIERFWAEGGEPIGLIRATQRHFQRLHRVAGLMEAGTRYEEAAKKLRPPVFWKQSGPFRYQARSWSRSQLELALSRLGEAELVLKSTGTPAQAACGRTLYAIASMKRA